jgi:hypothetical protein
MRLLYCSAALLLAERLLAFSEEMTQAAAQPASDRTLPLAS